MFAKEHTIVIRLRAPMNPILCFIQMILELVEYRFIENIGLRLITPFKVHRKEAFMVLLIVDAQEMIVTKELYRLEQFITNVKLLMTKAREAGIEIIYIQHDDGVELTKGVKGFEIFPDFAPLNKDKIFVKQVNSAFKDTGLVEYLKSKKEEQVVVVGLQTDYCVDATIKCGFEHGFEMIVPASCNTTVDNEFLTGEQTYQYYNHKMWNRRYAKCISLEEALVMLEVNGKKC